MLRTLTSEVAIAALPHVHWTSGGKLDLARVGAACRKSVPRWRRPDASLGVLPFNVDDIKPDFAVAACYKWLLGPYTVGVLYAAPKWHSGAPLEEGWIQRANSQEFSSLVLYDERYDAGARRFDMGERSNFALLPVAARAMQQILEWGIEEISTTSGAFNRYIAEEAAKFGFVAPNEPLRATHYLCLRRSSPIPPELTHVLARENVFVSVRGTSMRVTPHVYNTREDCDRLLVLRQIAGK